MAEDKKLSQLIINEMTKAQYDALPTINEDEIYVITDAETAVKTDNTTVVGDGTSANPIAVSSELLSKIDGEIENRTEKDEELEQSISDLKTTVDDHIADKDNPHEVTKLHVGLSNVDNTSDANKPVSTAQQAALDLKADKATTYTKTETDGAIETALEDYVTFTDYASQSSAGVIKVGTTNGLYVNPNTGILSGNPVGLDTYNTSTQYFIISKGTLENVKDDYVKRGLTENSLTFTEEEQTAARTLINAVGPNDYATSTEGGTVLVKSGYGIGHNTTAGLYTVQASEAEIDEKANQYTPITPKVLDYAVKVGVTTNTITLTDDEKSVARTWIGAVSQTDLEAVESDVSTIESKIPAAASSTNLLADRDFVSASINTLAAFYLTSNATGDAFATKAALVAGPYYFQGELRTATLNDYAIVIADETKNNASTRYMYDGAQWDFQYVINDTPFTQDQVNAINSTITQEKVESYSAHIINESNPHNVTKEQVGLGNVDNTSDLNKPISTATQTALNAITDDLSSHVSDVENPHNVTKAQVGLGNVNNTSDIDKPVSTAQQAAIDAAKKVATDHIADKNNPHEVTKAQVGLGNVDNTSDLNKPVSTATQTALNLKANAADVYTKTETEENAVFYTKEQALTVEQQALARANIDSTRITDVVISRSWPNATFLQYSKQGTKTNWTLSSEIKKKLNVGDIITISATITDRDNCNAFIFAQIYDMLPNNEANVACNALLSSSNRIAPVNVSEFTNDANYVNQTQLETHTNNTSNPHKVTKTQIGLGNVDNTSDLAKPISLATQEALDKKQETLTAGTNITIDGTTISAKDTTYSAGAGISIDKNGVISNTYVSGEWGKITGTLANQTDLKNALDAKANTTDIPVNVSELTNDSGYITASSDITGNAATATKLANKRTIALTGGVTGSGSFDGSANLSMSTTVVGNLHNHGVNQIKTQDESGYNWTAGGIDMITRQSIGSARSNKSFNLPAEQITIEYSQDGGQTWVEYPCTDEEKRGLFTETRQKVFYLGGSNDINAKTLDWQLRVTVLSNYTKDNKTYYDRYVTVDGIYMWASTSGNKFYYTLEKALNGTPDVWTEVFTDQQLSGWSGNNIRYMQTALWGSTAASNAYGFRMTFYMKELSSGYASSTVSDIRLLGAGYHSGGNEVVKNDRLFKIDTDLNAEFPSNVKADLFEGPSTSTKAVEWQQGTANTASYVWFSDSTSTTAEGVPVWTTKFKYNPTSDTLTVGNITGNAATATNATTHIADTNVHVTTANKATWNAKQDALSGSANIDITDNVVSLTGIVPNDNLPGRLREFSNNSEAKVSSADSATKSGFWQTSSGSPFTTGSGDFALSTNAFSATYICQIAQCYYDNQLAYRVRNNGVWTDWRLVAWADEVALKQDKLTAGDGIVISDDNEISVSLTSVPWGNITGDISQQADLMGVLSNKQNKLVAGTNMEVSGANISTTATRITIRDWSDL